MRQWNKADEMEWLISWNDLKIRIRFEPVKIRYLINSPTKPITETASLALSQNLFAYII